MVKESVQLTEISAGKNSESATSQNFQQYVLGRGVVTDQVTLPAGLPKSDEVFAFVGPDPRGDKEPKGEKRGEDKEKSEAKAEKEKKKPKDGDVIPLSKLLKEYDTPFNEAYKKSKTFKALVDRMKACPWADQIKVRFSSKIFNPDYDPGTSTITINPSDPKAKQIEMFAHEAHHATNAKLHKLYLSDDLPKTAAGRKKLYIDEMTRVEVEAFKAEIDVHKELKHPGIVSFKYVGKDGKKAEMDLAKLSDGTKKGEERLATFVLDEGKTMMSIPGKKERALHTYREYYEAAATENYEKYLAKNQENFRAWVRSTPGLAKKLKDGDY
jgi:hypothetical protein